VDRLVKSIRYRLSSKESPSTIDESRWARGGMPVIRVHRMLVATECLLVIATQPCSVARKRLD
jgi:hypothetical protein